MPAVPSACAKVPLDAGRARLLDDGPDLVDRELAERPGVSAADRTPPVAMTLIQSAPARIWSRVARRTASTPSAMPGGRSLISVVQDRRPTASSSSPWPPVWESGRQLTCVRGPGNAPEAKARLMPAGA